MLAEYSTFYINKLSHFILWNNFRSSYAQYIFSPFRIVEYKNKTHIFHILCTYLYVYLIVIAGMVNTEEGWQHFDHHYLVPTHNAWGTLI